LANCSNLITKQWPKKNLYLIKLAMFYNFLIWFEQIKPKKKITKKFRNNEYSWEIRNSWSVAHGDIVKLLEPVQLIITPKKSKKKIKISKIKKSKTASYFVQRNPNFVHNLAPT